MGTHHDKCMPNFLIEFDNSKNCYGVLKAKALLKKFFGGHGQKIGDFLTFPICMSKDPELSKK